MKKISFCIPLIAIAALLSFSGCGGKKRPEGMPELFPLTLNVTQGGAPAKDVKLLFFTDGLAWGVGGQTGADGKAVIKTQGEYDGAPAGEYKVVAEKYYVTPSKYGIRPADLSLVDEWNRNIKEENAPVYLNVAPEFLSPESTPIVIKVEKGTPTVNVDLGEKVEIQVDRNTRKILE